MIIIIISKEGAQLAMMVFRGPSLKNWLKDSKDFKIEVTKFKTC